MERLHFENREDWLANRGRGIGASEAAAAVGESKFCSRLELWKRKTGRLPEADLSGNEAVQRGVRMENALREWFKASHPELEVSHFPYDMLFQPERPWIYATLDAEFRHRETGKTGIVEIKTASPRGKEGWAEWEGRVPTAYYDQILHQHLATGETWFYLVAGLWTMDGDVIIREFEWQADDGFILDASWLLEGEEVFWGYVQRQQMPPEMIRL